jgi:hypothetical protein
MKERYQKVLIHRLEEYLPSDVVTQMLEADVGGKPPHFFLNMCGCGCGGGGGVKSDVKIVVPSLNPCPIVKMSTKLPL